jgi:hypothetical protein
VVPKEVARHCAVQGLKVRNNVISGEPVFARIEDHTIRIMDKYEKALPIQASTGFLIFTSKKPFPAKDHDLVFPESVVIITTKYPREEWYGAEGNQALRRHTWAIARSGAYCKRL